MHKTFALTLLSAIAVAQTDDAAFVQFAAKFNKNYRSQTEMNRRKSNWKASSWQVAALNSSGDTATYEVNLTGDLDTAEYIKMLGIPPGTGPRELEELPMLDDEIHGRELQTAANIDWTAQGKVFPVKNQGSCGSCWAFSANTTLEAMISIQKSATAGSLVAPVHLSEQQLVDCTLTGTNFNYGCNGGWSESAWGYAKVTGLMTDADYPYVSGTSGVNGAACLFDSTKPLQMVTSYNWIAANQASTLLTSTGPINVYISVGNCNNFRFYRSGYLSKTPASCQPTGAAIDHAVVIVGQETMPSGTKTCYRATSTEINKRRCVDATMLYSAATTTSPALCCKTSTTAVQVWKIQNQWSTNWGDQGFIRVQRMDAAVTGYPYGIMNINAWMQQVVPTI